MRDTEQYVLALPIEHARHLYRRRLFYEDSTELSYFFDTLRNNGDYVARDLAEESSRLVQIVSCAVIIHNNKILCLRRTRKTNRAELSLRWTVMIGGHVDDSDQHAKNPTAVCAEREVKEELGFNADSAPELLGLAIDPATPVGRHHIGVIYKLDSSWDNLTVTSACDNAEFVNSSKTQIHRFKGRRSVENILRQNQFDPWSSLFLNSNIASNILGVSPTDKLQRELALPWKL